MRLVIILFYFLSHWINLVDGISEKTDESPLHVLDKPKIMSSNVF